MAHQRQCLTFMRLYSQAIYDLKTFKLASMAFKRNQGDSELMELPGGIMIYPTEFQPALNFYNKMFPLFFQSLKMSRITICHFTRLDTNHIWVSCLSINSSLTQNEVSLPACSAPNRFSTDSDWKWNYTLLPYRKQKNRMYLYPRYNSTQNSNRYCQNRLRILQNFVMELA